MAVDEKKPALLKWVNHAGGRPSGTKAIQVPPPPVDSDTATS
jgi:hypothetical protein